MRCVGLASLCLFTAFATPAWAQQAVPIAPPSQTAGFGAPEPCGMPAVFAPELQADPVRLEPVSALWPAGEGCTQNNRIWFSTEYLLYWIKNGPLAAPLVTTSNPTDLGTLGAPSTRVLFGGDGLDYGTFSGIRASLGGWLDPGQSIGIAGRGFLLEQRTTSFSAQSDDGGNPLLAFPVFDPRAAGTLLSFSNQPPGATLPGEAGLFITQAGNFTGGLTVSSSSRLWGAEGNSLLNIVRNEHWQIDGLAGFRYLDLGENLDIETSALGLSGAGTFAGAHFLTHDMFQARNQFYGGQLGLQTSYRYERVTVDLLSQLALGSTHQVVNRSGSTDISNSHDSTLTSGTYPGGLLAVPTNSGRVDRDAFAVVPEVELKIEYAITASVRVFVGYDFLYWSNVVRPADQLDRVVNPSQVPAFGGLGLSGPARPAPIFQTSDFWAQGINFGLDLRF
jgi:Putative beta barrel porin-7 (BBP7)